MATVEADGAITLLGRGSNCINTGGEKVFPEEVEEAIKVHPAVEDALVSACPTSASASASWASRRSRRAPPPRSRRSLADARTRLASFKLPRQLVIVKRVPRAPNGKADYPEARKLFEEATAR